MHFFNFLMLSVLNHAMLVYLKKTKFGLPRMLLHPGVSFYV